MDGGDGECRTRTEQTLPILLTLIELVRHRMRRGIQPLLALPRPAKRGVVLCFDLMACLFTVWATYSLRLEVWHVPQGDQWIAYILSPLIALPIFVKLGLYRAIFRYAGPQALFAVGKAVGLYGLIYALVLFVWELSGVPRSAGLIQPLLLLVVVGGSRLGARIWLGDLYLEQLATQARPKVLIYGAGAAGRQLAMAIGDSHELVACGFLDDDPRLHGSTINGLRIHPPHLLPRLIELENITDVLLAMPSVSRSRRYAIIDWLQQFRVHTRTLPRLSDLANGRVQYADLHELDLEDLLAREPVSPDPALMGATIAGKVVMVSGAGGSIGSELCRQILGLQPHTLLLVDHNEFGLYTIHDELLGRLADSSPSTRLIPLLASVRDGPRMSHLFAAWRPDTVYHAAAYKHVPLVEHNPGEGLSNNVLGTLHLARAAIEHGTPAFILISTDKAVRPTNIMGASKRVSEMILQALAARDRVTFARARPEYARRTRFSMVRFGNVLGSSGSVVPRFRQQIEQGGPITLTHPDVTRFFMTISEAAQLVLQAGAMAEGGDVFVLDMGKPVRIMDLARRMVELSGCTVRSADNPHGDIAIEITGLRPGEKLYEELLIGENPLPTAHPRIMKAREGHIDWPTLHRHLDELSDAIRRHDVTAMHALMHALVSGYAPAHQGVDWIDLEATPAPPRPAPAAAEPVGVELPRPASQSVVAASEAPGLGLATPQVHGRSTSVRTEKSGAPVVLREAARAPGAPHARTP